MISAAKLAVWFIVIFLVAMSRPSLSPPHLADHLWELAILAAFPVGAFFSARGAKSGIPFILYAGAVAALYAYDDWRELAGVRGMNMSDELFVKCALTRTIVLIVSCRLAASLRWWIAQHREREKPPRCAKCGYLLFGLTEPRCPECGEPFDESICSAPGPSTTD